MGKLILTCGEYLDNASSVSAIVNAANEYMIDGSGICGVIYKACGPKLLEYCKNNYKENMKTGDVRVTCGFNLKNDIIHVLSPKYYEEREPIKSLMDCYINLLEEIKLRKYKKVLLCSLGTGIYGYKHEDVSKTLMKILIDFCKENDVELYFNNMYPIYKDIYLKEYLDILKLNLQDDLRNKNIFEIKKYLEDNNLIELNLKEKYDNYIKNRELSDLGLTEKLILLEYVIFNFDISKEDLDKLLNEFKD